MSDRIRGIIDEKGKKRGLRNEEEREERSKCKVA